MNVTIKLSFVISTCLIQDKLVIDSAYLETLLTTCENEPGRVSAHTVGVRMKIYGLNSIPHF